WGRVICMASIAGLMGGFGQTAYSTSKMGVVGFAKSVALEGARYNVTSNVIAPGIAGPNANLSPLYDRMVKRVAMQREGQPEDIASAVAFLCSERALHHGGRAHRHRWDGPLHLLASRSTSERRRVHADSEGDLRQHDLSLPRRQGGGSQRHDPVRHHWGPRRNLERGDQGWRLQCEPGRRRQPEPDPD